VGRRLPADRREPRGAPRPDARGRQRRRAAGVLDLLLVIGVPVTSQRSGAVLRAEMAADGLDRALPVATDDPRPGPRLRPRAARDLVERLVRARRLDEARAWLERFRARGRSRRGAATARCSRRWSRRSASTTRSRSSRRWSRTGAPGAGGPRAPRRRPAQGGRPRAAERLLDRGVGRRRPCRRGDPARAHVDACARSDVAAVDRVVALLVASGVTPTSVTRRRAPGRRARRRAGSRTRRRCSRSRSADAAAPSAPDGDLSRRSADAGSSCVRTSSA
jgi:hypothetical protein